MFTIINVVMGLFGVNLSNVSIRLILIGLAIITVLGLGFYFRHEVEKYISQRAYSIELQQNQAQNAAQLAILNEKIKDDDAEIQAKNVMLSNVKNKFTSVTHTLSTKQYALSYVGPATQDMYNGLQDIWTTIPDDLTDNTPVINTEKEKLAPSKIINPSIEEWLKKEGKL